MNLAKANLDMFVIKHCCEKYQFNIPQHLAFKQIRPKTDSSSYQVWDEVHVALGASASRLAGEALVLKNEDVQRLGLAKHRSKQTQMPEGHNAMDKALACNTGGSG